MALLNYMHIFYKKGKIALVKKISLWLSSLLLCTKGQVSKISFCFFVNSANWMNIDVHGKKKMCVYVFVVGLKGGGPNGVVERHERNN